MSDHSLRETPKEIQSIYEGFVKGAAKFIANARESQIKRLEVSTESIEDDIPNMSVSRDNSNKLVSADISISRENSLNSDSSGNEMQPTVEIVNSLSSEDNEDEVPVFRQSKPIDVQEPVEQQISSNSPELGEPGTLDTPIVYPGFPTAYKTESVEESISIIEPVISTTKPKAELENAKTTGNLYGDIPFIEVIRVDENDDLTSANNPENAPSSHNDEVFNGLDDNDNFYSGSPELLDENIPVAQVIRTKNLTADEDNLPEKENASGNTVDESEYDPLAQKPASEDNFANLSNELLFKNSGQDPIDKLTKEDAMALSLMLKGEIGESIPNAANLKIMVDGKVVAQADAQGRLVTLEQTSPALSQYFSSLAKEENRPSVRDGSEQVAKLSEDSQAPGHQFMQGLVNNMKVQESAYMPAVTQKDGLIETDMSSVDSVLNLYATKNDNDENYQLKNGGVITSRTGNDETTQGYQFFTVEDAEGNIDMGFTVCPDGQILVDPKITNTLQNEISAMQEAWDKGEISEDTPLMTKDKARAEAVQGFTRNIESTLTNDTKSNSSSSVELTTNKKNQIVATSKKNPNAKMVIAKGVEGKMRILSNSLSTNDILEFNKEFKDQKKLKEENANSEQKESSIDGRGKPKKLSNSNKKAAPKNTKSKRQGQSM